MADFCGLASRGYVFEPVGSNNISTGQDLSEFLNVLAMSSLPPEEASIRRISNRMGWVSDNATTVEAPNQREEQMPKNPICVFDTPLGVLRYVRTRTTKLTRSPGGHAR